MKTVYIVRYNMRKKKAYFLEALEQSQVPLINSNSLTPKYASWVEYFDPETQKQVRELVVAPFESANEAFEITATWNEDCVNKNVGLELFIHKANNDVFVQEVVSLELGKRVVEDMIKRNEGSLLWACILKFGVSLYEYHNPHYSAFLRQFSDPTCERVEEQISKDALTRMAAENPALFDKYLDFINQKKSNKLANK